MIIHTHRHRPRGRGIVNSLINKLPFELHLPGYQYCGPGTKLAKRLARGDLGINSLDRACKEHDIAYSQNRENGVIRKAADKVLANQAWERVLAKDADIGEKVAAYSVSNIMKLKSKLGMGVRKRTKRSTTKLSKIIKAASDSIGSSKNSRKVILSALKDARIAVKKAGGKNNIIIPRVLPINSKVGGFLPFLVSIFAGLSAAGAIAGGTASIVKTINDASAAKMQLEESRRHNKKMEDVSLGKDLFLKPYKRGLGLSLKPYRGSGLRKEKKRSSI